jgi:hypothetical protein
MKKKIILFFLTFVGICNGQNYSKLEIFQFTGNDSLKKTIALTQTFNTLGQLTTETYNGYKRNLVDGPSDGLYFYYYKDTLLTRRVFVDNAKDSTKMLCHYNKKKQSIKQEHFTFKKRNKINNNKGQVKSEDIKTWEKTSEIDYSYDEQGNEILYDATKLHFTSQNKYTSKYDNLGRVLQYCSFSDERLIWVKDYSYFLNGYKIIRTWYDYEGNPEHLKTKSWEYTPQNTYTFYLDKNGRVLKEVTSTEKNEKISAVTTFYNSNGQISRTVYLNEKDMSKLTHIYTYN